MNRIEEHKASGLTKEEAAHESVLGKCEPRIEKSAKNKLVKASKKGESTNGKTNRIYGISSVKREENVTPKTFKDWKEYSTPLSDEALTDKGHDVWTVALLFVIWEWN